MNKKALVIEGLILMFVIFFVVILIIVAMLFSTAFKNIDFKIEDKRLLVEDSRAVETLLNKLVEADVNGELSELSIADLALLYSIDSKYENNIKEEISNALKFSYGKCYGFKLSIDGKVLEASWKKEEWPISLDSKTTKKLNDLGDLADFATTLKLPRGEFSFINLYNICLLQDSSENCNEICNVLIVNKAVNEANQ